MRLEQIIAKINSMLDDNRLMKDKIDEEWNGIYGSESCHEYDANAAYEGALLDVLSAIEEVYGEKPDDNFVQTECKP